MGHSLWISMHGGGSCPALLNDEQYQNQISLYKPNEGIWVVPRSPTDSWNQWHQEHIDPMFDRIIENHIMVNEINPNRVYILGYSAGGDGVYQLAPRMADRFAAAAMMAGHPNDASPLGLRNLPFAIFVGENDNAYNRNEVARKWAKQLDTLQESDPNAYHHYVNICADMGHWMCGRDAEALSWMSQWARNPWPKKVIWVQDDVTHTRLYWLSLPDTVKPVQGQTVTAEVNEQTIRISTSEGIQQLTLCLSDNLLDLDEPINVEVEGHGHVFQGRVPRTKQAIEKSLRRRADPTSVATAFLELSW
jgi:predicted esterase